MQAPQSVFIVLTTDCDKRAACPYCFYNVDPDRLAPCRIDTKTILVFLKKMRLLNMRDVYLTGGEPLLRDDLEEIIFRAREMGMRTYLLSNGRSLTTERAARLDSAGLDVFSLSFSGLEIEDRKTIAIVRKFKRAALSMIFVLTAKNISLAPDVIEMASALNSGLIFQPVYIPSGHELHKTLSMSNLGPFEWPELHGDLRPWAVKLGYENYLRLFYDFYNKKIMKPSLCGMGKLAYVMDSDGEVYPCFHRRDLKCGNVLEDDVGMLLERLSVHADAVSGAACFGEHCISLHTGYGG